MDEKVVRKTARRRTFSGYFIAMTELTRQESAEKGAQWTCFSLGKITSSGEIGLSGELTLTLALPPAPRN